MNLGIIVYMLGWIMKVEAVLLLVPMVTAAIYGEREGFCYLAVAVVCGILGLILSRKKPRNQVFYAREGFVTVSLGWLVLSFFGCMPFMLSGEIPRFVDAMYEIVSGFTTTGSSIVPKVEELSKATLIWRSFSHWIGGMGVLVFILAVLPMAGDHDMHIMRAESPGPSVGKLVPKIRVTAKLLYTIYFVMTVVMIVLLLIGKMPLFDSLCMSFGAAGTGGFSCRNAGQADYTTYQQAVIAVFMLLFGVNFSVYYLIVDRRWKDAFRCEELRGYLVIVAAAVVMIAVNVHRMFPSWGRSFHEAFFQVSSIITTTGYATVDFDKWPEFSKCILLILMFIGACAGSTGGGMKVSRVMMAFKEAKKEIAAVVHPRSVKVLKFEGKPLGHDMLRSLNAFIILYFFIFFLSVLLVSLDNYDFMTTFSAVASNLNNIGPGMSAVGPMSNFSALSDLSKTVLIFDMLAGRLELFPVMVLLSPGTWKRTWTVFGKRGRRIGISH
ncbi:MAG TPA: TrkH family potassium uptake protein [Candidatus Lachnoclostridium pullistercoris]|uniref:TrkH family potassium uptake protein n=1 Tax=Candidatus Lachnoclostridium pullistercoris TaxID=2838632 RepID=A0A9D2PCZ9_9FIRM|nr:TrkH family potassium uptake protein [Candidatus Lachnoclostridium pullistercoris]